MGYWLRHAHRWLVACSQALRNMRLGRELLEARRGGSSAWGSHLRSLAALASPGLILLILTALSLFTVPIRAEDNCTNVSLAYGWTCTFNSNAPTQLDIWSPWSDDSVFVESFVNSTRTVAAKRHDVKFVITLKSWGNAGGNPVFRDELTAALLSNAESAPEMFPIGTRWLGYLQDAGLLYNVTERWKQVSSEMDVDTIASVKNIWAPNDVWHSIPMQTDTMFLVYNKESFREMNVSLPPFQITWSQLYKLAKQVNNTANGKCGFGLYEANAYSSCILFPLVYDVTGNQARLFNSSQCLFDTPDNIAALQNFTNMWTLDKVAGPIAHCPRSENDGDMPLSAIANRTGGAAMMILAPGNLAFLQKSGADLGVSSLPRTFLGGVGLSISSKAASGTVDSAFEVIQEFVNPANNFLTAIANEANSPPPIYTSVRSLSFEAPWNVEGSPAQAAFLDVNTGVDISFPNFSLPYSYLVEEMGLFRCLMADIVEGRRTVAEAVGDLCSRVNTILARYCPAGQSCEEERKKKKEASSGLIIAAVVTPILAIIFIVVVLCVIRSHRRRRMTLLQRRVSLSRKLSNVRKFSSKELQVATNNFTERNLLGSGSFGEVYSGVLPDGERVAVKKLQDKSYERVNEFEEFVNEVKLISAVRHKNLVNLLGYCIDGADLMLAYELVPNGSLQDALWGRKKQHLSWRQCFQILMGTAEGICYLHEGCQPRIIHRDIKPANILLDSHYRVRLSDFGMAKDTNGEVSHVSTRIMGTLGYLDPCYSTTGQLTEKSDVYSFGMVVIAVLLGRKPRF